MCMPLLRRQLLQAHALLWSQVDQMFNTAPSCSTASVYVGVYHDVMRHLWHLHFTHDRGGVFYVQQQVLDLSI